jgi:hypothetical protein
MAARGSPKVIVSDNASQLIVVDTAMKKMASQIQEILSSHNIEWKYIPSVSPWMGGFYERLVGVVKRFLKKALDGLCVTLSELSTVVAEITAVVNSRPLLYVEDDVTSLQLRPVDLLGCTGSTRSVPVFESFPGTPKSKVGSVICQWKKVQGASVNFWNMWRKGYLTSLREKHSRQKQRNVSSLKPTVGSVVHVKEDKMPRGKWKIGRIERLIASRDGAVRSAEVRLVDSEYRGYTVIRPVKLLYPIEMQVESDDEPPATTTQDTPPANDDGNKDEDEDGFDGFDSQDIQSTVNALRAYNNTKSSEKAGTRSSASGGSSHPNGHSVSVCVLIFAYTIGKNWRKRFPKISLLKFITSTSYVFTWLLKLYYLFRIMSKVIDVVYGHPLSPYMTFPEPLTVGEAKVPSILMGVKYIELLHHDQREAATQMVNSPIYQWQPNRIKQFVESHVPVVNAEFRLRLDRVYGAVMFEQLKDSANPFYRAVYRSLQLYGVDAEIRVYSSGSVGDNVLTSGCKYPATKDVMQRPGAEIYTELLHQCFQYVHNNVVPTTELQEFLTYPDMFWPIRKETVFVVSDSQSGYLNKVEGGDIVPISGGRYIDMVRVLESGRFPVHQYRLVICYPGSNIYLRPNYTKSQRDYEFELLRTLLIQLAQNLPEKSVMFVCGVEQDTLPKERSLHTAWVRSRFAGTGVLCLNWQEFGNPFLLPEGRRNPALFDKEKQFHLTKEASLMLWKYWQIKIPKLRLLNFQLSDKPMSVLSTVFRDDGNGSSGVASSSNSGAAKMQVIEAPRSPLRPVGGSARGVQLSNLKVTKSAHGKPITYREVPQAGEGSVHRSSSRDGHCSDTRAPTPETRRRSKSPSRRSSKNMSVRVSVDGRRRHVHHSSSHASRRASVGDRRHVHHSASRESPAQREVPSDVIVVEEVYEDGQASSSCREVRDRRPRSHDREGGRSDRVRSSRARHCDRSRSPRPNKFSYKDCPNKFRYKD